MAASLMRFGARGARQVLMEQLGLQAVTLSTKAAGPPKKKKVKGAEAGEESSRDSHIQAAEITSIERESLLSKKTVLLFPRKNPGPSPLLREALSSAPRIPEDVESSAAASHSSSSRESVGEKPTAEGESSSSPDSSSSSDSDEETVTEDAVKTPVELPKRESVHCTPARSADRIRDKKEVDQGGLVNKPEEISRAVIAPVSKDSTPTEIKREEREPQAACLETIAEGNRVMPSSEICAGAKATVTTLRSSPLPKAISITQETTASISPKEWVPPAQSGMPEPENESAEEITPEPAAPALAEVLYTPQESVEKPIEPVEEILDTSTYKNTQHHDYTPLTFIDLDMEMANYRLPQPSSGRMTARH